jgi:hypothetical protein
MLTWTGRGNLRDPRSVLLPYFEQVFGVAGQRTLSVVMHLSGLAACNSSTISAVIDAIRIARETGVALELVYDATVRWQRMSFEGLRVFVGRQPFTLRAA